MSFQGVLVHVNSCGVRRVRVKPFTSFNASRATSRCSGASSIRSLVQHPTVLKIRRSRRVQAAEGAEEVVVEAAAAAAAAAAVAADVEAVDAVVEPEVDEDEAEEEFEFGEDYLEKTFTDEEKALLEAAAPLLNVIEDEFEAQVREIFNSELTTDESTSLFEAFGQLDAFTAQLTSMTPEKLEELLKDTSDEDIDFDDDVLDVVSTEEVLAELTAEAPEPIAAEAAEPVEPEAAEPVVAEVAEPVEDESAEPVVAEVAEPAAEAAVPAEAVAAAVAATVAAAAPAAGYSPVAAEVKALRVKSGAGMMDCKKALIETQGDLDKALEFLREKGLISAGKKAGRVAADGMIKVYVHPDARFGLIMEINCETDFVATNAKFQELVSDLIVQCMPDPTIRYVSLEDIDEDIVAKEKEIEMSKPDILAKPESIREKMVAGRVQKNLKEQCLLEMKSFKETDKTVNQVLQAAVAALGENIKVRRFERLTLGEGVQKKEANLAAEVAAATTVPAKPKEEAPAPAADPAPAPAPEPAADAAPKKVVQIAASLVKELREATGAGMMDCKKALQEHDGDMQKATELLRKKGLASAAKKAGRVSAEGQIYGYSHPDGRFGILMEINCETDFVATNAKFSELAQGIIYNIASNKEVQFVAVEDIPADFIERERRIAVDAPELAGKPEEVKAKIVEGKLKKVLQSLCLLYQPYVYDQKKTVEDILKEAVASLGENIKVRRFARYDLGEGIEKKSSDLAAEVAAMTGN